ncbi:uncharacterized protein LOC110406601 [Numida meleagris]|uniref:uncharacterized protein LOC110406601 n=1 Tax=Numida meleagris TaxID=8996 RepID=UPI000B3E0964|nr:uncharacterized protein LOC110406601 [Numida meleagris]
MQPVQLSQLLPHSPQLLWVLLFNAVEKLFMEVLLCLAPCMGAFSPSPCSLAPSLLMPSPGEQREAPPGFMEGNGAAATGKEDAFSLKERSPHQYRGAKNGSTEANFLTAVQAWGRAAGATPAPWGRTALLCRSRRKTVSAALLAASCLRGEQCTRCPLAASSLEGKGGISYDSVVVASKIYIRSAPQQHPVQTFVLAEASPVRVWMRAVGRAVLCLPAIEPRQRQPKRGSSPTSPRVERRCGAQPPSGDVASPELPACSRCQPCLGRAFPSVRTVAPCYSSLSHLLPCRSEEQITTACSGAHLFSCGFGVADDATN